MRRLRFLPEGHLVEVTTRTLHGRLLLRPGEPFNELFVGVLGRAQRLHDMEIHYVAVLSNHVHLLLSPKDQKQLSRFMAYLNGNLAKEVGRLRNWREKVFGRRYQAIPVSQEEAAQVDRLRYLLAHGVKEGLVGKVRDWPGPQFLGALLRGESLEGAWYDRTSEWKARHRGQECDPGAFKNPESVRLSPLPCWRGFEPASWRAAVRAMVKEIETAGATARAQREQAPLGREAVLRQDPESTPLRSKRSPAPFCHAASRAMRDALRSAYAIFAEAYRAAAARLRAGDRSVIFPPGSFPPALAYVAE